MMLGYFLLLLTVIPNCNILTLSCALRGRCYPETTYILTISLGSYLLLMVSMGTFFQVFRPVSYLVYLVKFGIPLLDNFSIPRGVLHTTGNGTLHTLS